MNHSRIDKYRQQLHSRPSVFGGWLQNHALKTLAEDGSAEAMRGLADTVVQADEEALAAAALESPRQLAARDNGAAREAPCRLVIHQDEPGARPIVSATGCVPPGESTRAP